MSILQISKQEQETESFPHSVEYRLPQDLLNEITTATPPPAAKPTTYTTAGTVYNPETTAPILPPARKGRNHRYGQQSPGDLSFLPAILNGLDIGPRPPRSPTTTASSLKHYAPLQQNNHRAVTPPNAEEYQEPLFPAMPLSSLTAKLSKLDSVPPSGPRLAAAPALDDPRGVAGMEEDEDDSSEDLDTKAASLSAQFNVKGLTNLASYSNPTQKAAQKALARARAPLTSSVLRPEPTATPSLTGFSFEKLDVSKDRGLAPSMLRGGHAAVATAEFGQRGRGDEAARLTGAAAKAPDHGSNGSAVAPNPQYSSTLSTGPGAPRPLTAGPPGLRQYRSSAFESTLRVLQQKGSSNTGKTLEGDGRHSMATAPVQLTRNDQALGYPPSALFSPVGGSFIPTTKDIEKQSIAPPKPTTKAVIPAGDTSTSHQHSTAILDTAFPDQISKYYPSGMPSDYKKPKVAADPETWQELQLQQRLPPRGAGPISQQAADLRRKKIDREFQIAAASYTRTMYDTINELERRAVLGALGGPQDNETQSLARNAAIPRPLSMEEINRQHPSRDAEPFLHMAFTALFSYVDGCGPYHCPKPFETPDPWVIDNSQAGRQSFFATRK